MDFLIPTHIVFEATDTQEGPVDLRSEEWVKCS